MKRSGTTGWRSPANIAVVKYWGKKGFQLPVNPSVSMTLTNCFTETIIEYNEKRSGQSASFDLLFQGTRDKQFEEKTGALLKLASDEYPVLKQFHFSIMSSNSFPHSAGIASSASSLSAMALCICQINRDVSEITDDDGHFFRNASRLARLGSGSACRSVYGGWVLWGKMPLIKDSSDDYAIPLSDFSANVFNDYYDAILVVDSGIKQVTSSSGHKLMENNPFREARINNSFRNVNDLLKVLKSGDEKNFGIIAEKEAAILHAMFLTSDPYFITIRPGTLQIINILYRVRQETGMLFSFTLDAGPNIHLIYPGSIREKMVAIIKSELTTFCENGFWIDDKIGKGPAIIQNE
jgi:diphosphomevalonate decarboxylase